MFRRLRVLLLTIEFLAGACLLCLEFVGQRMLAVTWGDSLPVWGAAISVVLAGLALGYGAGGRLADRRPAPSTLMATLAAGAVGLAALALVGAEAFTAIGDALPGVRAGVLVASAICLLPTCVVLGMTTPLVTKLRLRDLDHAGADAGDVYAVGTLGSIAGALATTFIGLQTFTLTTLLALCAALMLTCAGALALAGRHWYLSGACACALLVVAAVAAGGSTDLDVGAGRKVLALKESPYHRILVTESGDGVRYLQFNATEQGALDLDRPQQLQFAYAQLMQRAFCHPRRVRDAALIGVGAGSMVRAARLLARDTRVDAVDIDADVIDIAHRWFRAPEGPGIRYRHQDGRRFMASSKRRYDVLLLDAFSGLRIPPHLTTYEFFGLAAKRMAPGGVLAVNLVAPPNSKLTASLLKTLRTRWPGAQAYVAASRSAPNENANIVMFASDRPVREECLSPTERKLNLKPGTLSPRPLRTRGGVLLTDGFAPVDQLRGREVPDGR